MVPKADPNAVNIDLDPVTLLIALYNNTIPLHDTAPGLPHTQAALILDHHLSRVYGTKDTISAINGRPINLTFTRQPNRSLTLSGTQIYDKHANVPAQTIIDLLRNHPKPP